jgi:hypothetical protein
MTPSTMHVATTGDARGCFSFLSNEMKARVRRFCTATSWKKAMNGEFSTETSQEPPARRRLLSSSSSRSRHPSTPTAATAPAVHAQLRPEAPRLLHRCSAAKAAARIGNHSDTSPPSESCMPLVTCIISSAGVLWAEGRAGPSTTALGGSHSS